MATDGDDKLRTGETVIAVLRKEGKKRKRIIKGKDSKIKMFLRRLF